MSHLILSLSFFFVAAALNFSPEVWAASETAQSSSATRKEVALSGKVLETMNGGGYTYILLKGTGEQTWVAVPLMKVVVGQELNLVPGYEMKNFTSKGLNRKFDRVVFSAGPAGNKGVALSPQALKMAHQGVPQAGQAVAAATRTEGSPQASAKNDAPVAVRPATVDIKAASKNVKIAKAKGRNAYTIAELYARKTKLEKKPVVVRGRVVKVTPRILKKNWIHIQDGSGSAAKKTDDLILTTTNTGLPNVGDVVTVKGTLYNNIDFGSGYRYSLIVEKATISK
ncbi:MAG: DNA-binding protein [Desulfuromonadaceae bacterium]|nr:DNA-binding protein [Desulfuromonadaceae bacterium]MDD5107156.1 DNA-binding protein [Desulfuromonadaceae bacterium]